MYLRVSTNIQECERQKYELEEIAKRYDYNIVYTFEEKKSAVKDMETRDELTKLRSLTKDDIDIVLVWDITRLSRKASNFIHLVNEFGEKGIAIHFKDKNIITLDESGKPDAMFQMYLYILGSFAQMDAEAIKAKMLSGKENALRRGNSYTNIAPIGYYLKDKKLYIKEDEAEIIRKAFNMYSNGETLQAIADLFNANKIPLKSGRKDIVWVKGTIAQTLKNTVYYGKGKRVSKEYGERFFDAPAIISEELFMTVQQQFKENKTKCDKSRDRNNLLRGLLRCGNCGKYYVLMNNNNQLSYRCGDTRANINNKLSCDNSSMRSTTIDGLVWEAIREYYYKEEFRVKTEQEKKRCYDLIIENNKKIEGFKEIISQHNQELVKIQTGYTKGFITDEYMALSVPRINSEIKRYNSNIDKLIAENAMLTKKTKDSDTFDDIINKEPTISEKKHICNELINEVLVYKVSTGRIVNQVVMKNQIILNVLYNIWGKHSIVSNEHFRYNKDTNQFICDNFIVEEYNIKNQEGIYTFKELVGINEYQVEL